MVREEGSQGEMGHDYSCGGIGGWVSAGGIVGV